MRAVALLLAVTLIGCFPHNDHHRTIAKITEGGVIVGGITILAIANSSPANCEKKDPISQPDCKSRAGLVGTIGLGMILLGIAGFIGTVSSADDDDDNPTTKPTTTTATPAPKPAPTVK
jgi:hypothetical protein